MSARNVISDGKPTVISTFAGCGGSSLGFHMAGFRELLAVEYDKHAAEMLRLNFPDVPVYQGDITLLDVKKCFEMTGLQPGELDVLDGSPPCQGFSSIGNRMVEDPRNSLFREYVRLLQGLKPKVFVMENVTGMIMSPMKTIFLEIMKTLRGCGYKCKAEVMNAKYYGVPQSRRRVIIIGVRDDLDIAPSHPKPATKPLPAHVCQCDDGSRFTGKELKRWKMIPVGGNFRNMPTTLRSKERFGHAFLKLDPFLPAPTITATHQNFYHWSQPRRFTIEEIKCFCSFPKDFKLTGSYGLMHRRLGNAVPPKMMKAIAEHIKENILSKGEGGRGNVTERLNTES